MLTRRGEKGSTWAQIIEVVAIMFMKVSLVLFIQRIIDRASRKLWHFLNILNGFIVITHFIPLMLYLLQCRPLPAVWDPTVQGECYSTRLTYTAAYVAIGELYGTRQTLFLTSYSYGCLDGPDLRRYTNLRNLEAANGTPHESGYLRIDESWCSVSTRRVALETDLD